MARNENEKLEELLHAFEHGNRAALPRIITIVENRGAEANVVMERLYDKAGGAHIIGITGPPGAGKSTLINRLVTHYRRQGKQVAVLAIDPSSRFSGGAVLGDRIR